MKSKFTRMFCILMVVSIILANSAFAHSGRTDSSGGHKDNKNKSGLGSYHYHCGGYPAHLHSGGVCPYSSKAKAPSATKKPSATPTPIPTRYVDGIEIPDYDFPVAKGAKGNAVKDIQKALIDMGYLNDVADGIYGNKTELAIISYCDDHNANPFNERIEYDGYLDESIYVCIIKDYKTIYEDAA